MLSKTSRIDLKRQLDEAGAKIQRLEGKLHAAHEELEKTNSELMQLTLDLEDRVEARTSELQRANRALKEEIEQRKKAERELQRLLKELKDSQAQLIQAEKMSAVGTMTAGIAHELNNPMMGVLNYVQYCLKKTAPEDGDGPNKLDSLRGRISSEPPALDNQASGSLLEWMRKGEVDLIRG